MNPHSLVWSADGARLRFTLTTVDGGKDELWEIGSDGANLRQVLPNLPADLNVTAGAWSANNHYYLFTGGSDPRMNPVMDAVSNVWASREARGFSLRSGHKASEITHGPVSFRKLTATGDSGRIFALPTYFFVVTILILLGVGVWHVLGGTVHPVFPANRVLSTSSPLTLFLLLTAFSSGCAGASRPSSSSRPPTWT